MSIKKQIKQKQAISLIGKNKTVLLEGGSRSGKTFIIIYTMIVRALHYPNTWHLAARLRLSHATRSLWMKTIPDVLKGIGIQKAVKYNGSNYFIELPSGSRVWVDGLDDKERVEKILGNEYATIYYNEASQINYDTFELVSTRLNPPRGVPGRILIDYNPPSIQHWGYKIFHKREFPDGRKVPDNDYRWLQMNPEDNKENLSEDYIPTLKNLSIQKRKRFLDGEYGVEEGALWKREWIKYGKVPPNVTLIRVVVGVDPSGSATGDEIGIIVAGLGDDGKYYILADYTLHGSPQEWSEEVFMAYNKKQADKVVAEKNYGGDMVEATITQMGRKNINVELITASRGKAVRAEPISALYERGEVIHTETFMELEDELCTWRPEENDRSPNRLDALVFALTELGAEGDPLAYV